MVKDILLTMKNILLIEKYFFNFIVGKEILEIEMDMLLVVINNLSMMMIFY